MKLPLVIRDPVHDLIRVDCPVAAELIQTEPFQRLRRIKQLGLAYLVYPGAEHTRFNHSLGVYYLAQRAMNTINLNMDVDVFNEDQRQAVGLSALLHDLGHGPFSHQFERFTYKAFKGSGIPDNELNHESWTKNIVLKDTQITGILNSVGSAGLIDRVHNILVKTAKPAFLVDLVSSQLDMDRLDYLIRDSHFAGCQYGKVDKEWILRSLTVANKKETEGDLDERVLAIEDLRGRNCIEQYLLGRHFMNIHLYYHKTIAAAEAMVEAILLRALGCIREKVPLDAAHTERRYPVLDTFAERKLCSVPEYLSLDDTVVTSWIVEWARGGTKDKVLQDLCARLITRQIFVRLEHFPPSTEASMQKAGTSLIQDLLTKKGLDPDYYCLTETKKSKGYSQSDNARHIHVLRTGSEHAEPLSDFQESVVIAGKEALAHADSLVFVPREYRKEIETQLQTLKS